MDATACLDDRATGVSIGRSQRSHNEMRRERIEVSRGEVKSGEGWNGDEKSVE